MNADEDITSIGWKLGTLLPPHWSPDDISESIATLFFLKWVADTASLRPTHPWLARFPHLPLELGSVTWEFTDGKLAAKGVLHLMRTVERNIQPLAGLTAHNALGATLQRKVEAGLQEVCRAMSSASLADLTPGQAGLIFEKILEPSAQTRWPANWITPESVRKLMVGLLKPTAGTIYDPICRSGSLLWDAATAASSKAVRIFGREPSMRLVFLARMNAMLRGIDANIALGDALREAAPDGEKYPISFDYVLANPPFNIRLDPAELASHLSPRIKTVGRISSELAFIDHISRSLSEHGRAVILLPNGFLIRDGVDKETRKELINSGRLHAVIALPGNLFYGTPIPATVLVLHGAKNQVKETIFADLSCFAEGPANRKHLSDRGIALAIKCFDQHQTAGDSLCSRVPKEMIVANDYDLLVSRYTRGAAPPEPPRFAEELQCFKAAIAKRAASEQKAFALIEALHRKRTTSEQDLDETSYV